MTETQHPAVARVAAALRHAGHAHGPQWLQDSAHTAQQAADSLGVALGAIAKSVVLALPGGAVLCVTAGDRRVDASRLPQQAGASAPTVLTDPSLWRFAEVWAAAGHPRSVFAARPDELLRLAGAQAHDFTESAHV